MQWAEVHGVRHQPSKGIKARCPSCQGELIAKCGTERIWHWAHKTKDCDSWSEPETMWHKNWKGLFPPAWQEVVIGEHRADVQTPSFVIEFQHSPISVAEVAEREQYYKSMFWVFDLRRVAKHFDIQSRRLRAPYSETVMPFKWKWKWRSVQSCRSPVFVTFGKGRLYLIKFERYRQADGFCQQVSRDEFLSFAIEGKAKVKVRPVDTISSLFTLP